ncbi:MAG: glycoside hydrolase domain-containing protein, partial [Armatimonadota bacterium]
MNNGTAWFDDLAMTRVKSGLPTPQPPAVKVETPAGAEGCLQVTWDPKTLTAGAMRVLVYCEEKPLAAAAMPVVMADSAAGKATIWSLETGKSYRVATALVNGDSEVSARGAAVTAKVLDRQAPRPGWLTAERFGKTVHCMWQPHLLDVDVASVELLALGADGGAPKVLKKLAVVGGFFSPRGCAAQLPLPEGQKLGARATDAVGNVGEIGWIDIAAEKPATALTDVDMWVVPATENVARSAEKPVTQAPIEPLLMRGQGKGLQLVIRPQRDLHEVEVSVRPSQGKPNGVSGAASFVNYVHLDANSIATPKEELVWPAPGEYPDEISADPVRDLPAGQAQPVYVELKADAKALPGKGGMEIVVRSREGTATTAVRYEVSPVALPSRLRLPFVYWFTWGAPCKEFGVEERTADGWRVLGEIGKQMVAHGERCVVVPWSMVRVWQDAEGKYSYDFRDFDHFLKTFQAVGVDQLFCLSHVGGRTTGEWECPTMSPNMHQVNALATGDIAARLDAVDLLPALQAHIEKLGLIDKFRLHIADEPIAANLESYKQLSARAHAAAPKLKRIDAEHVPDLQGYLEDWVPQINY